MGQFQPSPRADGIVLCSGNFTVERTLAGCGCGSPQQRRVDLLQQLSRCFNRLICAASVKAYSPTRREDVALGHGGDILTVFDSARINKVRVVHDASLFDDGAS